MKIELETLVAATTRAGDRSEFWAGWGHLDERIAHRIFVIRIWRGGDYRDLVLPRDEQLLWECAGD